MGLSDFANDTTLDQLDRGSISACRVDLGTHLRHKLFAL